MEQDQISPRWAVCISYAIIFTAGIFLVLDIFTSIKSITYNTIIINLMIISVYIFAFYFAIYIPIKIINRYLKTY